MVPRKLSIGIVRFPYAGNGATEKEHPDITDWLIPTIMGMKADERIGRIAHRRFTDCPITMTRNASIEWAKKEKLDLLLMIDSDQSPDMYVGIDPDAKPFFSSSFDFLYGHYDKGPITIFAPYCGPPPHPTQGGFENPYVFKWEGMESDVENDHFKLTGYTRAEAAKLTGILEAAAGPTGLCLTDMRCFEHMTPPYFYYQFEGDGDICPMCGNHEPGVQAEKSTTEDVAFFRDLSLAVCEELDYNPVFCNWDAWAGHHKTKCVGKPNDLTAANISKKFKNACQRSAGNKKRIWDKPFPEGMKPPENGKGPVEVFEFDEHSPFKGADGKWLPGKSPTERLRKAVAEGKATDGAIPPQPRFGALEATKSFEPLAQMDEIDREYLRSLVERTANTRGLNDKLFRIVELGSWAGRSAELMATEASRWCRYELHCVDHFQGAAFHHKEVAKEYDVEAEFRRNTERFGRSIILHRSDTLTVALEWAKREDTRIDLLFIDADHTYKACLDDIRAWTSFVVPGGLIVGHDYQPNFPGVKRAVHEFFGYDVYTNRGGSCWVVIMGNDGKALSHGKEIESSNGEVVATNQ